VIFDGYVSRLWRLYMFFFDGQKIWNKLINHVNKKHRERYIRLNIFLPKDPLVFNNTNYINKLRKNTHLPQSLQDYKETLYALFVFAFYFELYNAFF